MAATKILAPRDFNLNEIQNAKIHLLASDPGSPVDGQVWINTTGWVLKIRLNGVTVSLGRLDQISAPTADVAFNSRKITGLLDPTAAQDAATKAYVDSLVNGIDWKQSVRAATTANGALATAFANGQVIDGVTLATGDRILVKNQTTGSENGIYTVNASGAPTRATDADASAEVTSGMATPVNEGTANADSVWILTTNDPITLGTTALVFTKAFTAGASGLTKVTGTIGNGALTAIPIAHNIGSQFVTVQLYEVSTLAQVEADIVITDANTVTVNFTVAPATNAIRYVIIG